VTDQMVLASFSAAYLSRYFLALVRVLAAFSLNPLLGSARVPMLARVGLGVLVTFIIFPPGEPGQAPLAVGPTEIAGEVFIGLLAGFAVALVFGAIQLAASFIGVSSGFGMGATFDPHADLGSGALQQFFSAFALVIFVEINGHHLFLTGLHELFQVVEVGTVALAPATMERLIAMSAGLFSAAVKMALPVVAALLLTDLGMAILARVAPQFNVFALEQPAKVGVGLAVLGLALPVILPQLVALFRAIPQGMLALGG